MSSQRLMKSDHFPIKYSPIGLSNKNTVSFLWSTKWISFLLSFLFLSFFLSFFLFSTDLCLPTHCRCIGYCYPWSQSMTYTHNRYGSSGKGISPLQRPLPDKTQQSLDRDNHSHVGIRTRNPSKRAAADPRLRPDGHCDTNWILWVNRGQPFFKRMTSILPFPATPHR